MDGSNQYGYYQQGMGEMQNYQMPNSNMVPVGNSDGGYMYQNQGGTHMGNSQIVDNNQSMQQHMMPQGNGGMQNQVAVSWHGLPGFHSQPVAAMPNPSQSAPQPNNGGAMKRRLLDHYDFYRTPDGRKVKMGGGNYATVWRGFSKLTGEEVAFKIIVKNEVTAAEANPMHAEILKMVDHKNIIQLKDYFDEDRALCLVLELAHGGDIVEKVHSDGVFTEAAAVRYCRQILSALAHCHKRGLVHCDIKCENILFASRDPDSELKLADFGLAQLLRRGDKLVAGRGTPEYVAPEVIESTGYDTSADMWSVGVLVYTWMSGVFPFSVPDRDKDNQPISRHRHREILYKKISECNYSEQYLDRVSPEAKDFIRQLLRRDPKQRMTAERALQHPWIAYNTAPSRPLNHNLQALRRVREQEGVSHAFYSVLLNSSGSGEQAPLLLAATTPGESEDVDILGRGVAPLITMAYSARQEDQEQAAELIANCLLRREYRDRLVEGGVFRALAELSESQNVKVLNFVGLAMYRITLVKAHRHAISQNKHFLDRMVALGQSRSNMVARQAGRAFCEMLKEESIREELLKKGVLKTTCRLLQSDMIVHQAEALASWGSLTEHKHLQSYLLDTEVQAISQIHRLVSRESTSPTTLSSFFQAAFILQQLTLDRLEEVGPIIIREALPTVERLSRHSVELIRVPAMRTLRRLMVGFYEEMWNSSSTSLQNLMREIKGSDAFAEEEAAYKGDTYNTQTEWPTLDNQTNFDDQFAEITYDTSGRKRQHSPSEFFPWDFDDGSSKKQR
mmetsp:Transcript_7868/g.26317  ORF Transcript_7868/g.26317 Transcript_7868/m.26317 type:complete len:789 (+) Transcript_7868:287-2653(+)